MEIKYFTVITAPIIKDLYILSKLMVDANELKRIVFLASYTLLKISKATFFIAFKKNKKVAYGLISYGTAYPEHRRLTYFAVKKSHRGQGYGTETLKMMIKEKVILDSGISLCCPKNNRTFYEYLGFKELMDSSNIGVDIIMSFHSSKCDISADGYARHYIIDIDDNGAYPLYKDLEKQYNIQLIP